MGKTLFENEIAIKWNAPILPMGIEVQNQRKILHVLIRINQGIAVSRCWILMGRLRDVRSLGIAKHSF